MGMGLASKSAAPWPAVQVDPLLIIAASALEERHALTVWDALIIEAARRAGANHLVSEDVQHSRRLAGLVIANIERCAVEVDTLLRCCRDFRRALRR